MEGRVTMSKKESRRYGHAMEVVEGRMTVRRASELVGVKERQMARIVARVRKEGMRGVQHGLRGRRSNHAMGAEQRKKIAEIVRKRYEDFGPTMAAEKLAERHGLRASVGTVRKIMMEDGLWKAGTEGKRHRARRERRARRGEMIQVDGSHHDWFEGRRGKAVLLGFIDDATSEFVYGVFVEGETTEELMRATWEYGRRHGLPGSLYVDCDSIYVVNRQATIAEQLRDMQPQTQFDRAMEELDIEVILARSPQAKGRVERLFKTLQDRLVKEMRLRGISTLEEANRYLDEEYLAVHNDKFAVEALEAHDAHRAAPLENRLAEIFSIREERTVQNDYTVRYKNKCFQIGKEQGVRVRPKQKVIVEEHLDGTRRLVCKGVALVVKDITGLARPRRNAGRRTKVMASPSRIERWKPAADHPWRNRPVTDDAAPREGASFATLPQRPRAKVEEPCHF
jgi:hypothetical protein